MNSLQPMIYVRTVMALAIASACVYANAAAPKRTGEYVKCMKVANAVDPVMRDCVSDEIGRQDKLLNAAYKKLLDSLDAPRRKELVDVQRLWLKYTEANCAFYDDPEGGTNAKLEAMECAVTARILRTNELVELARYR
ncbi:lysozyme inhibitor LprI family protein [Roseateles sp. P5_E8]